MSLYLANIRPNGRPHWAIRETFVRDGRLASRDLFDLGPHPGRFIRYPGGNAFHVSQALEAAVRAQGARPETHEIEDLLWPFVDPRIRHAVGHFRERARRRPVPPALGEAPPHAFDQRRMAYLRCGPTASGRIGPVPERLLRPLAGKSRDAREQLFLAMENDLRAGERKTYVFQVFDLQRHMPAPFGRSVPQWSNARQLDIHFEAELCRLQADEDFWSGMDPGTRLNPYLIRYAIMFFDGDFGPPGILEDLLRQYLHHRRHLQRPEAPKRVGLEEASAVFGLPVETLRRSTRRDLLRHYRRAALRLHPDQGGDPDRFVRLTEVYQALLRRRGPQGT